MTLDKLLLLLFFCQNTFAQKYIYTERKIVDLTKTTDLKFFPSTPYQLEGAGYNGAALKNLKSNCMVTFSPKGDGNVADELNTLIDKLSKAVGGKITIPKGDYILREVNLKSNIQIYIESGVTIKMDDAKKGKQMIFIIGSEEGKECVANVRIIGVGCPENRPQLLLAKYTNKCDFCHKCHLK